MKMIVFIFLFVSLFFISGCTEQGSSDTYVTKKFNTYNSFYANGLSCSSFKGNSLSGVSGSSNRSIVLSNFPMIVVVDTFYLNSFYDYNVFSFNNSYIVYFNNPIWNDQDIGVCLATSNTTISNSVYLGSNCSGSDGSNNRVLVSNITNILIVAVDNFQLVNNYDYTSIGNTITFNNKIYDSQVISVWG